MTDPRILLALGGKLHHQSTLPPNTGQRTENETSSESIDEIEDGDINTDSGAFDKQN